MKDEGGRTNHPSRHPEQGTARGAAPETRETSLVVRLSNQARHASPLSPRCGERVRVRGSFDVPNHGGAPHPADSLRSPSTLSPRRGARGLSKSLATSHTPREVSWKRVAGRVARDLPQQKRDELIRSRRLGGLRGISVSEPSPRPRFLPSYAASQHWRFGMIQALDPRSSFIATSSFIPHPSSFRSRLSFSLAAPETSRRGR
jgi:hypothetical protein